MQKDGTPAASGISMETYEEMAEAFFNIPSVNHVKTTCKVNMATAKKYIERGDERRGMPSIRERFIRSREKVIKEQDHTWAMAMAESLEMLHSLKMKFAAALEKLKKVKIPRIISLNDAKKAIEFIDKIVRLEGFIFGGVKSRNEEETGSGPSFADWSAEEMTEYVRTGKRPDRLNRILTGRLIN